MDNIKTVDIQALRKEADSSEHKEAYKVLEKSKNYRIGVGVRLESTNQPSFFLEVLVYLCPNSPQVDISLLQKNVMFLRELQARGYSLVCQDDNCISCETTVSLQNLASEYETVKMVMERDG